MRHVPGAGSHGETAHAIRCVPGAARDIRSQLTATRGGADLCPWEAASRSPILSPLISAGSSVPCRDATQGDLSTKNPTLLAWAPPPPPPSPPNRLRLVSPGQPLSPLGWPQHYHHLSPSYPLMFAVTHPPRWKPPRAGFFRFICPPLHPRTQDGPVQSRSRNVTED